RLPHVSCPPPTCPPFPYTTLFRSEAHRHIVAAERAHDERGEVVFPVAGEGEAGGEFYPGERRQVVADRPREHAAQLGHHAVIGPDRKSTRLNSSHVAISYAVFCLK